MTTLTEVKLLTLLNVSAVKRPRPLDIPGGHRGSPTLSGTQSPLTTKPTNSNGPDSPEDEGRTAKKRKSVVFGGEVGPSGSGFNVENGKGKDKGKGKAKAEKLNGSMNGDGNGIVNGHGVVTANGGKVNGHAELAVEEDSENEAGESSGSANADMFNVHFGLEPPILTTDRIAAASENEWLSEKKGIEGFGRGVELMPAGKDSEVDSSLPLRSRITPGLVTALNKSEVSSLVHTSLNHLGSYKDYYLHSLDGEADGTEKKLLGEEKEAIRKAISVHALNHVLKTRRRIIRNNEKLAHAAAAASSSSETPEPPRDQSFTRPKVLLLLPLRSLALHYLTSHLLPLAPPGTQIENLRPFTSSFSLPAEAGTDPLSTAKAISEFPIDHLVNFRGNSDDNFRFGIKITRKAWRVVMPPANEAKLMECDIIVASPLGMKMTAEREGSVDLLSSVEICLVDGVDVMQMQNWDHVQFIFDNLNKIPESPHGCDFSRVKPWYLDSQAKYLRQTILISRYDTPESRALFHKHCFNLQGKIRLERNDYRGVLGRTRPGVKQIYQRVDQEVGVSKGVNGDAAAEEVDMRLDWFVKKTIPALLKSAVSRENTLIVIPSYFDFVRIVDEFRKADNVSYAAISEYSSNSEISRARTLFFKGKKAFLLVTERFHFYRRYKIRGAKTIVFYALPEHAQFYSEFLETPFLTSKGSDGVEMEVDEGEVSCRVLFSRFDLMKLERVVGSGNARRILGSGEGKVEFS